MSTIKVAILLILITTVLSVVGLVVVDKPYNFLIRSIFGVQIIFFIVIALVDGISRREFRGGITRYGIISPTMLSKNPIQYILVILLYIGCILGSCYLCWYWYIEFSNIA